MQGRRTTTGRRTRASLNLFVSCVNPELTLRPRRSTLAVMTSTTEQAYSLSPEDAAAILGVSARTIRRWADRGDIASLRPPSGRRRFRPSDVEAFAERNRIEASPS